MICTPALDDLPLPPPGRTGWPWTDETPPVSQSSASGQVLQRISIVTPSLNQGEFIEETIRSVLLQGYPNLEFIIIDGGSTDRTIDIIRKYEPWLAYWMSEQDRGQAQAINKGFRKATGDILAWLNADDLYEKGTLQQISQVLNAESGPHVVFGDSAFVDKWGSRVGTYKGVNRSFYRKLCYWRGWDVPQPTVFVSRSVLNSIGMLDENLHLALDYEWFLRAAELYEFVHLDRVFARYRLYSDSKTGDFGENRFRFYTEQHPVSTKYWPTLSLAQQAFVRTDYLYHQVRWLARRLFRSAG
jgi:glycosyltransferase involved in cell wall biosynthesis